MKGKLSAASLSTFGIKIEGNDNWFNLIDEKKKALEESPAALEFFQNQLQAFKGKLVELETIGDSQFYKGIKLTEQTTLDAKPDMEDLKIDHYTDLQKIACQTEKKGAGNVKLTYISWAEAWSKLKKVYPSATYKVYENDKGMPYFQDDSGTYVKVGVMVENLLHDIWMPVLDFANKPMAKPSSFDINKSIQRALAKAIAMHGLGLYVYRGEDLPTE